MKERRIVINVYCMITVQNNNVLTVKYIGLFYKLNNDIKITNTLTQRGTSAHLLNSDSK